jgi:hypothetical protein
MCSAICRRSRRTLATADVAAAERDLHPSPDAWPGKPVSPTAELGEIEAKIANAGDRALGLS